MDVGPARQLLSAWTLDRFLCSRPPSTVLSIPPDTTLERALQLLARARVLSAPVVDSLGTYMGFLDVLDVLGFILDRTVRDTRRSKKCSGADRGALEAALAAAGAELEAASVRAAQPGNDAQLLSRTLHSCMNLLQVVLQGFVNPTQRLWCHRLAVLDGSSPPPPAPGSSTAAPSTPPPLTITAIISQSDIIAFLHRHRQELGPQLLGATLRALGFAPKPVVCVPADMAALLALGAVADSDVRCAGVVEPRRGGALVATLSASDLRGLLARDLPLLALPASEFLGRRRYPKPYPNPTPLLSSSGAGTGPAPAGGLAAAYGVKSPGSAPGPPPPPRTCTLETSLDDALALLCEAPAVHQLYLVGPKGGPPEGIITIGDLLARLTVP